MVHVVGDRADEADELVARVRARLGDEHAEVRLASGSPAEAIRKAADHADAELLVVGSRGRGGLRSAVLGSVSHDLAARGAPSPSWSSHPVRSGGPRRHAATDSASVVCGVDGSDHALAGAAFAGRLAERLDCRVVVVHARQNVRAALSYPGARSETPPVTGQADSVDKVAADVLQRAVDAAGPSATGVTEPGPPAEVLEAVADRENGRLIVITSRGLGGLRTSLLGSVAAELSGAATRPVVVLSEAVVDGAGRGALSNACLEPAPSSSDYSPSRRRRIAAV